MNAITNISPDLSRRHFLGVSGVLVLGTCLPTRKAAALDVAAGTFEPNLFLALDSDGTVRVTTHRSEMGQGIRTALAQVVADELDADWSRVSVVQAEGDAKYGDQNTDGSKSILLNYDRLRAAGASARLMLRQAAAKRWDVAVDTVAAVNHEVVHQASGRRLGYGELAGEAAALPVPGDAPLKQETEHRFIGKGVTHIDAADIARGKGTFGADFRLPNMATAVIVRCPWLGGGVKNIANKPTDEPGLVGIEILDPAPSAGPVFAPLGGVAVVAEDTWSAVRIARELDIEWTASPNQDFDSDVLRQSLRDALGRPGTLVPGSAKGDVDAAFEAGGTELEATYETPFLSHAPMEPPVAVADVSDGRCTVNAPLQDPQSARGLIAGYLSMAPDKVSVTPTLLGGAFGRKSKPDFALEAVELSKRLKRPVRVQWLREDDIRHDYFHAASAQYHRAVIDDAGRPTAWLQRTAFPSITSVFAAQLKDPAAWELDMGFSNLPYTVDNQRMEFAGIRPGVRVGWLRSVCNIFHAFSANVFADEMAAAVGRDPIEHRLAMFPSSGKLKPPGQQPLPGHELDFGRLRHVVERGARAIGVGQAPAGRRRPRLRRPPELQFVRRHRARGQCDQRPAPGVERLRRARLRHLREPGHLPRADGGCRGVRSVPRPVRRHRHEERRRGAEQFPRLPDAAHRPSAPDSGGLGRVPRPAASRRRRTRGATRGAGVVERPVRRDGDTPSHVADPNVKDRRAG